MKVSSLTLQRLPMVFATSILGAGLLLSSCSKENDDKTETVAIEKDANTTPETDKKVANDTNAANTEATAITDSPTDGTDHSTTGNSDTELVSKAISPIAAAAKQPSLLTNPTEAGTAEDTVKLALDTLYYGDVKKAATYYQVDMENFAEELKNTQFAFQQTVESVTITDTKYNQDKTRATVTGELRLKDQDKPAPLTYELQKIKGDWKILG